MAPTPTSPTNYFTFNHTAALIKTFNCPAGLVSGDVGKLMVVQLMQSNGAISVVNSGVFTELVGTAIGGASGANSAVLLAKLVDSTDVANSGTANYYSVETGQSAAWRAAVTVISGHKGAIADIGIGTPVAHTVTGTNFNAPAVVVDQADSLAMWCAHTNPNVADCVWTGATELYDSAGTSTRTLTSATEVRAATGDTGTRNVDFGATSAVGCAQVIFIRPSGPADTTAPTTPTGLAATSVREPVLTWTASTDDVGVSQYRIERRSVTDATAFAQIGTAPQAANPTYTDTAAPSGKDLAYRVRAADAAGNLSAYSNEATAKTPTIEALRPNATAVVSNFTDGDFTKIDQDPDDATITDVGLTPVVDP